MKSKHFKSVRHCVCAVVSVSLPVAFGLWFMMYPVLVKVRWEDFGRLFKLRDTYTQMGFSILANWVSQFPNLFLSYVSALVVCSHDR